MSKATYDAIYQAQKEAREGTVSPDHWAEKGFKGRVGILPGYGDSNHGAGHLQEVIAAAKMQMAEGNPYVVLDIGCGHNQFAKALRKAQVAAVGIDCSCPSADLHIDVEHSKLPYPAKFFQLVTGFDFLEHVSMSKIDYILADLARVGESFIFTIGTTRSAVDYKDVNLHEIQRPMDWWKNVLKTHTESLHEIPRGLAGRFK